MPVMCFFTTIIPRRAACLSNSAQRRQRCFGREKISKRLRALLRTPAAYRRLAAQIRTICWCYGIISSSYDVFANAQRIVKVKEAKSEQRTVMKSLHPIFDYESLADKPRSGAAEAAECAVFARLAIRWPNAALIS
ncbi:hypothetical protein IC615_13895 [Serratia ureilytica]